MIERWRSRGSEEKAHCWRTCLTRLKTLLDLLFGANRALWLTCRCWNDVEVDKSSEQRFLTRIASSVSVQVASSMARGREDGCFYGALYGNKASPPFAISPPRPPSDHAATIMRCCRLEVFARLLPVSFLVAARALQLFPDMLNALSSCSWTERGPRRGELDCWTLYILLAQHHACTASHYAKLYKESILALSFRKGLLLKGPTRTDHRMRAALRLAPLLQRPLTCPVSLFSTMTLPAAPQSPPTWHSHTPDSLLKQVKDAIAASRSVQDAVAAVPAEQATFDSVVKWLADDEAAMDTVCDQLVFMRACLAPRSPLAPC